MLKPKPPHHSFAPRLGISYALSVLLILAASLSLLGMILAFVIPQVQSLPRNPRIEASAEVVKLDGGSLVRVTVFNPGNVPVDINWAQTRIMCSSQLSCSVAGDCQSRLDPGQGVECILRCGDVNLLDKCVILVRGADTASGREVAAETWTAVRG